MYPPCPAAVAAPLTVWLHRTSDPARRDVVLGVCIEVLRVAGILLQVGPHAALRTLGACLPWRVKLDSHTIVVSGC